MTPDLKEFGAQVRIARTTKGWTLEETAHQVLGNQNRKSYVSAVENARKPKLGALTIQKFAAKLEIDQALVERLIRQSPDEEDARDQVEHMSDVILEDTAKLRADHNIKESLAIALAYEYAESAPTDYESAIAGLRRALEVAAEDRTKGALPANTGQAVMQVLDETDKLNDEGRFREAADALRREVEASEEREAEERRAREKLIEKGLATVQLARDVDLAMDYLMRQINLDAMDDPTRFLRLIAYSNGWRERGKTFGLRFDLDVAIALAKAAEALADGPAQMRQALLTLGSARLNRGERDTGEDHLLLALDAFAQGAALNQGNKAQLSLANFHQGRALVLQVLGEREKDSEKLEAAEKAYQAALKIYDKNKHAESWANAQRGLAGVLLHLGARDEDAAKLESAVKRFQAALQIYQKEQNWPRWATTQSNLGNAFTSLGEIAPDGESARVWLEKAISAYGASLKFETQDKVPIEWAIIQNNIGYAQRVLGEKTQDTAPLDAAKTAYTNALIEPTIDRVPMYWGQTQLNLSRLATSYFDLTNETSHLDEAQSSLTLARSVYDRSGATQFIAECDDQQAEIDRRR